jgi:hypothetical protein
MIPLLDPRIEQFDKAVELRKASTSAFVTYWNDFSIYFSLEYWMMVAFLVVPLIILFFKIDKHKLFLICFFGYSFHILFAYIDIYGMNRGMWNYPFQVIPSLPSLSIDSSIVPVTFMLVYQWTINKNNNYYKYAIIAALVLSFIFKPLLVGLGLFKMYGKINYLSLFIVYLLVLVATKLMTNLFLWFQKKYTKAHKSPNELAEH